MNQYAINLRDGRIVLCTQETLNNIDYYLIKKSVVDAIKSKKITPKEIISKIKAGLTNSQEEWDKLISNKGTQNMHHSEVSRDNLESLATTLPEGVGKDAFELDATTDEVAEKPKRGRPKAKPEDDSEELPLNDPE